MIKYIKGILIAAYVIISFLLIIKVLISESEILIKLECILVILCLFLTSFGSYSSWKYMKHIVEHKIRVNIYFAIHLMSYLIIVHFYYYAVIVQIIENIYLEYYLGNIAIWIILATNLVPMLYLQNLQFRYFQFNGKAFIKREIPL